MGFVDDSIGEALDREGADDRLAVKNDIGVDEAVWLANQPRCKHRGYRRAFRILLSADFLGLPQGRTSRIIRLVGRARRYGFRVSFAGAFCVSEGYEGKRKQCCDKAGKYLACE